jgi:hypothetical protein
VSAEFPQHTEAILRILLDAGVDFVLIGGVAAIAHGASTATRDVHIALPMDLDNLRRLLEALRPLDAVHFTRPDIPLHRHEPEQLARFRVLLLQTRLGRLDVLAEVDTLGAAADLPRVDLPVLSDRMVPVLARDALIQVKRHLGRPKDLLVVSELEALEDAG